MAPIAYSRRRDSAHRTAPPKAMHCTALRCAALRCSALRCAALRCAALHCAALHCAALHCTALHANSHKRYSAQHATCNMQLATCNVQHATCNMQRAACNVQHATYAHANLHARQSARHCTEACARWTRVRRNMHGSTSTTTTTSGSASTLCCAASGSRYAVAPPIVTSCSLGIDRCIRIMLSPTPRAHTECECANLAGASSMLSRRPRVLQSSTHYSLRARSLAVFQLDTSQLQATYTADAQSAMAAKTNMQNPAKDRAVVCNSRWLSSTLHDALLLSAIRCGVGSSRCGEGVQTHCALLLNGPVPATSAQDALRT